jgi:hypothetical protein
MFLKTSRYYKQKVVETQSTTTGKQTVKALTLRRLPLSEGEPLQVKGNHRLDIIAERRYKNPAMFWHIADANSQLQANDLVAETGSIIEVPEK